MKEIQYSYSQIRGVHKQWGRYKICQGTEHIPCCYKGWRTLSTWQGRYFWRRV